VYLLFYCTEVKFFTDSAIAILAVLVRLIDKPVNRKFSVNRLTMNIPNVYMRLAFFVRTKCLWFSRNAFIFKFHYTGEVLCRIPRPHPHHFSIVIFIFKIWNFTMQISTYQEGTKINRSEWVSFEEYWYVLEYKKPLISTSTSFLPPCCCCLVQFTSLFQR